MNRIEKNEKRLDDLNELASTLEEDLDKLEGSIKEYQLLNKYYGSKNWFKDKEDLEKGKIKNIKAGVLSEDAVWNLDEKISEILVRMDSIIKQIRK